jgi:hypothetical protein
MSPWAVDAVGQRRLDTLEDVLTLKNNLPFAKGSSEVLHQECATRQGFIHLESEML